MEIFPFVLPGNGISDVAKEELVRLENKMAVLMNDRMTSAFFKTPDEINADFYKSLVKREFRNNSDTLDGCMNIQQYLLNQGFMEENY